MTVATLVALAVLLSLGTWQLRRLAWKERLIADLAATTTAEAVPFESVVSPLGEVQPNRRVRVICQGLDTAPFIELYAVKDAQPGWRLISACPLGIGAYNGVLVDRGFVPQSDTRRPPVASSSERVNVIGVTHIADPRGRFAAEDEPEARRFYNRSAVESMARVLGTSDVLPYAFVMAETRTAAEPLRPSPLPTQISNNHLGYAITWYGLAAALVGVYGSVLLGDRRRGRAAQG